MFRFVSFRFALFRFRFVSFRFVSFRLEAFVFHVGTHLFRFDVNSFRFDNHALVVSFRFVSFCFVESYLSALGAAHTLNTPHPRWQSALDFVGVLKFIRLVQTHFLF